VIAKFLCASFLFALSCVAVNAQNWSDTSKINNWFEQNKSRKYEIQKPGTVQKPGNLQSAGTIHAPRGLAAIKTMKENCKERLLVSSDTLFEFDKATLTPYAEEALQLIAPRIGKLGSHPMVIEGHTDAIGDDKYNQALSERRAERVRNWLIEKHVVGGSLSIIGHGEKQPVAPNANKDGSDNPAGRALNRRVEIVINTCKSIDQAANPDTNLPPAFGGGSTKGAPATEAPSVIPGNDQHPNGPDPSPTAPVEIPQ
jgi:outer membrane protein OmpA-like peptidoglycan-associated protein